MKYERHSYGFMPPSLDITGIYMRTPLLNDVMMMSSLRMCLRPLLSAPSDRSWDASYLFDQQLFLKHCPTAEWPFFQYLFDTQVFTSFIEQRSFAHAESTALAFFDECTEKVRTAPHQ